MATTSRPAADGRNQSNDQHVKAPNSTEGGPSVANHAHATTQAPQPAAPTTIHHADAAQAPPSMNPSIIPAPAPAEPTPNMPSQPAPPQPPPPAVPAEAAPLPAQAMAPGGATATYGGTYGAPQPDSVSAPGQIYNGPVTDGRVRNPMPSKLKGKFETSQGEFSVMVMDVAVGEPSHRQNVAQRTSEDTQAAARRVFANGYVNLRRGMFSENSGDDTQETTKMAYIPPPDQPGPHLRYLQAPAPAPVPFAYTAPGPSRQLTPEEIKREQMRLLSLMRSIHPVMVVDHLCKALAFFGGVPGGSPPADGIFPESAEANGSGRLLIGWLAEIFPQIGLPNPPPREERSFQDIRNEALRDLDHPRKGGSVPPGPPMPPAASVPAMQQPVATHHVAAAAPAAPVAAPKNNGKRARGRPKGSKGTKPRKDKGIKKGPMSRRAGIPGDSGASDQFRTMEDSWVDVEEDEAREEPRHDEATADEVDRNIMLLAQATNQEPTQQQATPTVPAQQPTDNGFGPGGSGAHVPEISYPGLHLSPSMKRGRPKGSKNRARELAAAASQQIDQPGAVVMAPAGRINPSTSQRTSLPTHVPTANNTPSLNMGPGAPETAANSSASSSATKRKRAPVNSNAQLTPNRTSRGAAKPATISTSEIPVPQPPAQSLATPSPAPPKSKRQRTSNNAASAAASNGDAVSINDEHFNTTSSVPTSPAQGRFDPESPTMMENYEAQLQAQLEQQAEAEARRNTTPVQQQGGVNTRRLMGSQQQQAYQSQSQSQSQSPVLGQYRTSHSSQSSPMSVGQIRSPNMPKQAPIGRTTSPLATQQAPRGSPGSYAQQRSGNAQYNSQAGYGAPQQHVQGTNTASKPAQFSANVQQSPQYTASASYPSAINTQSFSKGTMPQKRFPQQPSRPSSVNIPAPDPSPH